MGDSYSEAEVDAATNWCRDEGYIEGTAAFGAGVVRPKITNKGLAFIEGGDGASSASTSRQGGDIYNISNNGAFNWAQNSSNVTQSNTLTQSQVEDVERILGLVRTMLNPQVIGAAEDVAATAKVIVGELEEEVRASAPSCKVKALLIRLMELAATGTVQNGIDALNAMIQQGINGIG
ncbi:hypothetical protein [Pseudarthrobacter scleromae]|uniref:hypothetical protein n=1 Tax=Pseudarthrobacter scleromae TaxID=158897 RepID=UPI003D064533